MPQLPAVSAHPTSMGSLTLPATPSARVPFTGAGRGDDEPEGSGTRACRVPAHFSANGRIEMKSLNWYLLVIGCMVLSLCSRAWATTLPIGQPVSGTIGAAAQINTYTFNANAGDVFDFTVATTSGSLSPEIRLFNPSGINIDSASPAYCSGLTIEMNSVLIPVAGTYTVWVNDCSDTNTGNYALYAQRINNPFEPVSLAFGSTDAGTIGSAAQSNTYTFSANANDVVDFTITATTGSLSPKIRLYSQSTGALVSSASPGYCSGSTIEMNTVTLPVTVTYTVLVGDCSDTNTGGYEIYSQRTDNPSPCTALLFGQTQTGNIALAAQSNCYTFSATQNDEIDFTMVTKSGTLSPKIRLYSETSGELISSANPGYCSGSVIEMNTVKIPATGTYTVLAGDCSDTNTGGYALYSQRTNNPTGALPLALGQTQTGSISSAAQSVTYTFSGNANDVVDFTMASTSGSLSPKIRLYNPTGTLNNSANPGYCSGSTIEMNTVTLPATGTYTVLVGDCSDTNTGNYAIYAQRIDNPAGPVPVSVGQVQTGKIASAAQSNTYTFGANANAVVSFTMTTTSGTLSPKIRLYSQQTGALVASANPGYCSGSTIGLNQITLTQPGPYTVLVGDCSDTNTGTYNITSECTGCAVTPLITWPAPAPITYGTPLSGTQLDATASYDGKPVAGTYLYSPAAGIVPDAGPNTLSVTFTPTPTDSAEFTPATRSVPLTVNKAVLTVTAVNVSRVYETPNPIPLPYTITGFVNHDPPTVVHGAPQLTTTAITSSPVGAYPITAALSTLSAANYTFKFVNGTLTVTKAKPVCTWATPAPIVVGTPLSRTQLDASCSVPGTYVYSPTAGTVLAVGVHTLSVVFTPTDAIDFTTATDSVTLTVINPYAPTPEFSVPTGTYGAVQLLFLTDATPGAAIYYTTNGQAPTTGSTKYTGPITVSASEKIEAFAVDPGYTNSVVASATYTIVGSPSALAAPATAISTPDATLNAIVNTLGVAGSYVFKYGTSATTLTTSTPKTVLGASTAAVPVSAKIAGLASKTTYYYQVVVTTAGGTGTGVMLNFTTN